MRIGRHALGLLLGGLLAAAPGDGLGQPAEAEPAWVQVRAGQHRGYTRIVFEWPRPVRYAVVQQGAETEIRFADPSRIELAALDRPLRNIAGVRALDGGVSLTLRAGVAVRHSATGQRVVIDLLDASVERQAPQVVAGPAPAPAAAPVAADPRGSTAAASVPSHAPAAPASAVAPAAGRPGVTPAAASPASVGPAPPPAPVLAPPPPAVMPLPQLPPMPAVAAPPPLPAQARLPFTGSAAAFRRFGALVAVFDAPPVAIAALRRSHPLLATAQEVEVPGAVAFRLPDAERLVLLRDAEGWALAERGTPSAAPTPINPARVEGRVLLPARQPGRTLRVSDPETGGLLLVGTLPATAQAVREARSFVEFDLLPTEAGVVLQPRSDQVELRAAGDGFAVTIPGATVTLAPEAARMSLAQPGLPRILELRDMPPALLAARRSQLIADAGSAGIGTRGPIRMELAETLLSLGLGAEAHSIVQLAIGDDPRLVGRPRTLMLLAAAATLAGRDAEALELLSDHRLPAEGEPALWRALAGAVPEAAPPALADAAPIALAYPAPLRARVVPSLAASLAEAGSPAAAALLDADAETAALPLGRYARARLLERAGDAGAALAGYAALAAGRDMDARARALGRVVELRLATGALSPPDAAMAMEAAIPAWRGDGRELDRRLRAAALHLRAAQPARALALLRETATLFPDSAGLADAVAEAALATATDPATPPLEAARLLAQRDPRQPAGASLDAAVDRIAERLLTLELPEEAAEVLRRALVSSPAPAQLSLRLGEALLAAGDPAGALEQLRGTAAVLPAGPAATRRAMAEAAAHRKLGNAAAAMAALRPVGRAGAAALAELHAAEQDWPAAAAALRQHLGALPPAPVPLDPDTRQSLLRLGAFLALAGDEPALAALREAVGTRMAGGPLADTFAALVAGRPDTTVLARLRQEMAELRR